MQAAANLACATAAGFGASFALHKASPAAGKALAGLSTLVLLVDVILQATVGVALSWSQIRFVTAELTFYVVRVGVSTQAGAALAGLAVALAIAAVAAGSLYLAIRSTSTKPAAAGASRAQWAAAAAVLWFGLFATPLAAHSPLHRLQLAAVQSYTDAQLVSTYVLPAGSAPAARGLSATSSGAPAHRPHVVVIGLESTRADALTAYQHLNAAAAATAPAAADMRYPPTSPFFDALAARGSLVRNAYSAVANSNKAIMSMFCGLSTEPATTWAEWRAADLSLCLPSTLRAAGYRTAVFTPGHVAGGVISWGMQRSVGWEASYGYENVTGAVPAGQAAPPQASDDKAAAREHPAEVDANMAALAAVGAGRAEKHRQLRASEGTAVHHDLFGFEEAAVTESLQQWLADATAADADPVFVSYFSAASHFPHTTPASYTPVHLSEDPLTNAYLNTVRYMDTHLEELFRTFAEAGLTEDNTVFVIAGDHGQALGEHGQRLHGELYEHSARVPLLLLGAGVPRGQVVEGLRRVEDIAPTVLQAAGLSDIAQLATAADGAATVSEQAAATAALVTGRSLLAPSAHAEVLLFSFFAPESRMALVTQQGGHLVKAVIDRLAGEELVFDLSQDRAELQPAAGSGALATRALLHREALRQRAARLYDAAAVPATKQARVPLADAAAAMTDIDTSAAIKRSAVAPAGPSARLASSADELHGLRALQAYDNCVLTLAGAGLEGVNGDYHVIGQSDGGAIKFRHVNTPAATVFRISRNGDEGYFEIAWIVNFDGASLLTEAYINRVPNATIVVPPVTGWQLRYETVPAPVPTFTLTGNCTVSGGGSTPTPSPPSGADAASHATATAVLAAALTVWLARRDE